MALIVLVERVGATPVKEGSGGRMVQFPLHLIGIKFVDLVVLPRAISVYVVTADVRSYMENAQVCIAGYHGLTI